uniref:Peroxidase n=1 Tax=Fagus sylvatica TaxID=28930 RepID=A0A2N9F8Z1_FAGSY
MGRCEVLSRAQKVQHMTALGVLTCWGCQTPFLTAKNFIMSNGETTVPEAEGRILVQDCSGACSMIDQGQSRGTLMSLSAEDSMCLSTCWPEGWAAYLPFFAEQCIDEDCPMLKERCCSFEGEKTAGPNNYSVRRYEVVDDIKAKLEKVCPGVVSCADILALAAHDWVVYLGGPSWKDSLGRRDSTIANITAANTFIPAPTCNPSGLKAIFSAQGLSFKNMVALSVSQLHIPLAWPDAQHSAHTNTVTPISTPHLPIHCSASAQCEVISRGQGAIFGFSLPNSSVQTAQKAQQVTALTAIAVLTNRSSTTSLRLSHVRN